jgi:hypothetical protein
MKKYRLLILITVAIVLMGIYVLIHFSETKASTIGSVVGAFGGVLAFVWFFAALRSQSEQLESQKVQFLAEFQTLREESRRNALTLARDILKNAEEKALSQNPELNSINDIVTNYIDFSSLGVILTSDNPQEVLDQWKVWLRIEGPAVTMIRGIKSAAEIYFRATELKDIDYSKEPEEFVYVYSPHIVKMAYFDTYVGVTQVLTQFMFLLQPGRKAALLAMNVALAKSLMAGLMKEDQIREEIESRKASGLSIPKIAENF